MKAFDIMNKDVVVAHPDTAITDVVDLLIDNNVPAAPVVDENNKLIGIVTEGDLLYKKVRPHVPHYVNLLGATIYYNGISEYDKSFKKLMAATAADLMTKNVIVAAPDADIEQLAGVMVTEHLKSIPIVKDGVVLGMVLRRDILRLISTERERIQTYINNVEEKTEK